MGRSGRDRRRAQGGVSPGRRGEGAAAAARSRPARRGSVRSLRPWLVPALLGVALLLGLIALVAREGTRDLPGVAVRDLGNSHIGSLDEPHASYNTSPPTSGPHLGSLASPGFYGEPIPNELQVHNLEDGFVLVQYDCPEECPGLVGQLEALVREQLGGGRHLILAPYAGIRSPDGTPARIALTAWARIDTFDEFDRERVLRFVDAFEGIDHHVRSF